MPDPAAKRFRKNHSVVFAFDYLSNLDWKYFTVKIERLFAAALLLAAGELVQRAMPLTQGYSLAPG